MHFSLMEVRSKTWGWSLVDIDGERSFKVWSRRGPRVRLSFVNSRYPEFRISADAPVEVWGVVSPSISPRRRAAAS